MSSIGLGIYSDYVIIGLAVVTLILLILYIVNVVQMAQLKKRYKIFMSGKNDVVGRNSKQVLNHTILLRRYLLIIFQRYESNL